MRPEQLTNCIYCKHLKDGAKPMLICAPKFAWEELLKWLEKQQYTSLDMVSEFIKDIRKNLKDYDKAGSTK